MKKWRAIVSIIIVFVLGAFAGALVAHKIYQHRVDGIMKGEPRTMKEFIDAEQQDPNITARNMYANAGHVNMTPKAIGSNNNTSS